MWEFTTLLFFIFSLVVKVFDREIRSRMVCHTMQFYCGHPPFSQLVPFH